MKNGFWKIILSLMGMLMTMSLAGEKNLAFDLSADCFNKYIWRGQNLNDQGVLQPAMALSAYGFCGSVWGNIDLTDQNANRGKLNEMDFTLDYSGSIPGIEMVAFSVGIIHYRFPNTDFSPTSELYGAICFDISMSPTITFYRDIAEVDGGYWQLACGNSFERVLTWKEDCYCDVEISGGLGWGSSVYNRSYFGVDSGQLNDFTLAGAVPFTIGSLSITPSINYSTLISKKIRSAVLSASNIWFGLGLALSI